VTDGSGANPPKGARPFRASKCTSFGLSSRISDVSSMSGIRSVSGIVAARGPSFPVPVPRKSARSFDSRLRSEGAGNSLGARRGLMKRMTIIDTTSDTVPVTIR
jgi:hypothetical protein